MFKALRICSKGLRFQALRSGSWKRRTNLTIKLDYMHYNALALNVQTNAFDGDTLRSCIDNVTIRRVSDDDVVCLTNTLAVGLR